MSDSRAKEQQVGNVFRWSNLTMKNTLRESIMSMPMIMCAYVHVGSNQPPGSKNTHSILPQTEIDM